MANRPILIGKRERVECWMFARGDVVGSKFKALAKVPPKLMVELLVLQGSTTGVSSSETRYNSCELVHIICSTPY
jgi:hypothetical protein